MVAELAILGLDALSILLILITIIFLVKNREYEKFELELAINAIIFSLFFLLLFMIINVIRSADMAIHNELASLVPDITAYIGYATQIADMALAPLFAVALVAGLILVREHI